MNSHTSSLLLSQALYCEHKDMHDSDSIIPPSTGGSPASYVPYSSLIRLPKSSRSGSGLSSGQRSDRFGTAPVGPPFHKVSTSVCFRQLTSRA